MMARALHLGGDQEHSMEVGDSRSQEPTLSQVEWCPVRQAHHQGKREHAFEGTCVMQSLQLLEAHPKSRGQRSRIQEGDGSLQGSIV